jgi:microcystin-dependent protein
MPANPFIGQLMAFAGNFAPRGWAMCNGQLLPISQNTALFSILGTTYGGNGTSNFALPDLQSRTPVATDTLGQYPLGEQEGVETVTLTSDEMPAHIHALLANLSSATSNSPSGNVPAEAHGSGRGGSTFKVNLYASGNPTALSPQLMSPVGGQQPHNNIQPCLTINWCIALQGIFPARN